jgi:hypothetical protein
MGVRMAGFELLEILFQAIFTCRLIHVTLLYILLIRIMICNNNPTKAASDLRLS